MVIRGIAVAIMVLSSAITNVESVRPNVSRWRGRPVAYFDSSSSPGSPSAEEAVAVEPDRGTPSVVSFGSFLIACDVF